MIFLATQYTEESQFICQLKADGAIYHLFLSHHIPEKLPTDVFH